MRIGLEIILELESAWLQRVFPAIVGLSVWTCPSRDAKAIASVVYLVPLLSSHERSGLTRVHLVETFWSPCTRLASSRGSWAVIVYAGGISDCRRAVIIFPISCPAKCPCWRLTSVKQVSGMIISPEVSVAKTVAAIGNLHSSGGHIVFQ